MGGTWHAVLFVTPRGMQQAFVWWICGRAGCLGGCLLKRQAAVFALMQDVVGFERMASRQCVCVCIVGWCGEVVGGMGGGMGNDVCPAVVVCALASAILGVILVGIHDWVCRVLSGAWAQRRRR